MPPTSPGILIAVASSAVIAAGPSPKPHDLFTVVASGPGFAIVGRSSDAMLGAASSDISLGSATYIDPLILRKRPTSSSGMSHAAH
jgi:hypothetical protein